MLSAISGATRQDEYKMRDGVRTHAKCATASGRTRQPPNQAAAGDSQLISTFETKTVFFEKRRKRQEELDTDGKVVYPEADARHGRATLPNQETFHSHLEEKQCLQILEGGRALTRRLRKRMRVT